MRTSVLSNSFNLQFASISLVMKKMLYSFAVCLMVNMAVAQTTKTHNQTSAPNQVADKPKLVIGIVVDQMRYDYLYRYKSKFGNGGFNRLLNGGFNVHQCHYNYVPTETAPGHASIYTGTTPSTHGIISNEWYDRKLNISHSSVEDSLYKTVGANVGGARSPKRLKTTTVTDELKLFSNFRSRIYGIALKDRAAILPAGHTANGAFWFDGATSGFVSSTYYYANGKLPEWAVKFNRDSLATKFLNEGWKLSDAHDHYTESTPDSSPRYETPMGADSDYIFDYDFSLEKNASIIAKTQWGNRLTKEFAIALLEGEKLGRGNETDFLCISFSSTDIIGHQFGINSVELEECYKKLDGDLTNFFNYIDITYGLNNVLIFLSADHGAANNPVFLNDNKLPGEIIVETNETNDLKEGVKKLLNDASAKEPLLLDLSGHQFYFNQSAIKNRNINADSLSEAVAAYLNTLPQVFIALPRKKLLQENYIDGTRRMMQNGFYYKESGDVMFCLNPATFQWFAKTGTTHGSPHDYDTHVPLLFYGWGIKKGETFEKVNITDIAPTVSSLLKISNPSGCNGKPIKDVFIK